MLCVHYRILHSLSSIADPTHNDQNSGGPPSGWTWPQLIPILLAMAYFLFRDTSSPIPSVPFSYFLKEMLEKGEVINEER